MLAITQFEVYALQKGRWTLHARYPGEERKEAVLDARTTEAATGFPTKVIRETYFPETNDSERITTYISSKAKQPPYQSPNGRRTPLTAARAAASAIARRGRQKVARTPRLTAAQTFFRIVVAGGISLAAATLTTGVFAWLLQRFAEAGVEITASTRMTLLTYAYVLMFLLIFWRLFRSKLALHRLLADLWQKSTKSAAAPAMPVNAKPPKVMPKHPRAMSPEAIREYEDLKVKRGDIDVTKPPELEEIAPTATTAPSQPPPQVNDELARAAAIAAQEAAERAARRDAKEAQEAAERAAAERLAAEESQAETQSPAQPTPPLPPQLEDDEAHTTSANLNLERMVLRRFAVDVVKPAVKSVMPDDPVARRAAAIIISGAAAGVAATADLNAMAEQDLLNDSLRHFGMNQAAVDVFLGQRTQQAAVPVNTQLHSAGRSALAAYLEGADNVTETVARAMSNWRTPLGHNVLPMPGVTLADTHVTPLLDVFVLTDLRENHPDGPGIDDAHDQAMGAHNGAVRGAIALHGGHEIKHTGKGIFARFPDAKAAADAAINIQRNFVAEGGKLAIAITGNAVASEDPLVSASLLRHALEIVARTGAGEILCESRVQDAIKRQQPPVSANESPQQAEQLDLVRLVVPGQDAEVSKRPNLG